MKDGWLAILAKSGCELKVSEEISSQLECETYCPQHMRWVKLARHVAKSRGVSRERIQVPLFPGYLFAKADIDRVGFYSFKPIKNCLGVVRSSAGSFYARQKDIDKMRIAQASGQYDEMEKASKKFSLVNLIGTEVFLDAGPLNGMSGVVVRARAKEVKIEERNTGLSIWVGEKDFRLTA